MSGAPDSPYFLPGGTLPLDAPSYIRRDADDELYTLLRRMEFCYILTSRQMGKSSLMVHVAARLQESGMRAAILDLNSIGHDGLDSEQWYFSLAMQLGERVGMEIEVEEYWLKCRLATPLQRWLATVRHLLRKDARPLVIFVDEIDQIRALPFPTDDFFAAIRNCYNRRAQDSEFARLAFCLIGTALPSELIDDPRLTPFNVGARIELTDFSPEEVASLEAGLGREEIVGAALLDRVYYWTAGHPYLTQRLCRILLDSPEAGTSADVDRICQRLFFSPESRDQEDNLDFVEDRLLRGTHDIAALLSLYRDIAAKRVSPAQSTSRLLEALLLSGVVRREGTALVVRNRIYATYFDRNWIREHMPDAEARRQSRAFRAGVIRTASVSTLICFVIAALGIYAYLAGREAESARRTAAISLARATHLLYDADIYRAGQAWNANDVGVVDQILAENAEYPGRRFEWGFLHRLAHRSRLTLLGHRGALLTAAISPDSKSIVTVGTDHTARTWDAETGRCIGVVTMAGGTVSAAAISADTTRIATATEGGPIVIWNTQLRKALLRIATPAQRPLALSSNGARILTGSEDRTAKVWDADSGVVLLTLSGHKGSVYSAAFSGDGTRIVTGSKDGTAILWDAKSGRKLLTMPGNTAGVAAVAISTNGSSVVTGSMDGMARVWTVATGRRLSVLRGHHKSVLAVAISDDGSRVVTGSYDKTAILWDAPGGRTIETFKGHGGSVTAVGLSSDESRIVTASSDGAAKVWEVPGEPAAGAIRGHTSYVLRFALSADGGKLVTGSADRTARIWDLASGRTLRILHGFADSVLSVAISRDGTRLVTGCGDGMARVWDAESGAPMFELKGHASRVYAVAFSTDGRCIVTGNADGTARVWDARTGRELRSVGGQGGCVYAVAFSPDGSRFITGGDDGKVRVYDTATGEMHRETAGHAGPIMDAAFSPNGATIATCGMDKTAVIWNAASLMPVHRLTGHTDAVRSAAYSADGSRLITASEDGSVKIWDADTGRDLLTLDFGARGALCAAISPDNGAVISSGWAPDLKIWYSDSIGPVPRRP